VAVFPELAIKSKLANTPVSVVSDFAIASNILLIFVNPREYLRNLLLLGESGDCNLKLANIAPRDLQRKVLPLPCENCHGVCLIETRANQLQESVFNIVSSTENPDK
jgi:hypothetical protein